MTLMGDAEASETLIEGYICTIGGCSTPQKQRRENTDPLLLIRKHAVEDERACILTVLSPLLQCGAIA